MGCDTNSHATAFGEAATQTREVSHNSISLYSEGSSLDILNLGFETTCITSVRVEVH